MGILQEFIAFAVKGNVIDMAVGIVIGAAFGKIVSSLVADIIMPPLGLMIGGVDFTGLKYVLKEATKGSAAVSINYGAFIQTVVDFLVVALSVFIVSNSKNISPILIKSLLHMHAHQCTHLHAQGVKVINILKEDVEAIAAKATEITSAVKTPRSSSKSRKSK